jgi:hypothetical protein
VELFVELEQQAFLLQVVAEIARLGVVDASVVAIKGVQVHGQQVFERSHLAGFDCPLQTGQAPVHVAVNMTILLAALFVQRAETFVEPCRTR